MGLEPLSIAKYKRIFAYSDCQKFCPIARRFFSRSDREFDLSWAWLGHRTCLTGRMYHWLIWRSP